MYGERPLTRCFGGIRFVIRRLHPRVAGRISISNPVECSTTFSGRLLISCIFAYDPCSGVDDRGRLSRRDPC